MLLYQAALLSDSEHLVDLLSLIEPLPGLLPVEEPEFDQLVEFREKTFCKGLSIEDLNSLTALALAVEGNQLRIEQHFRASQEAFRKAFLFAASGAYAPWLGARLLHLRASLSVEIGALETAKRDLLRAIALGGGFKTEWLLGLVYQKQGDHSLACEYFQGADRDCPPNLRPALNLALAYSYACAGQHVKAQELLVGVSFPDSYGNAAAATWIRGLIAKESNWPSSLALLEAAHAMFGLLEDLQGTALTAIDIALEYAEQGHFSKLRETAAAAYSILLGLGAEPQAIAAFSLMAQAEAVTLDAVPMRQAIIQALSRRAVPS